MRWIIPIILSSTLAFSGCGKESPKADNAAPAPTNTETGAEKEGPTSLPAPKGAKVGFKDLKDGDTVTSPLNVCITSEGLDVEASGPVNPGKGHHHILVDIPVPDDLSKDIPKDAQNIHLGDGSDCKEITLSPGKHSLRLLFADGSHRPYEPAITAAISVNVVEAKAAAKPAENATPTDGAKPADSGK